MRDQQDPSGSPLASSLETPSSLDKQQTATEAQTRSKIVILRTLYPDVSWSEFEASFSFFFCLVPFLVVYCQVALGVVSVQKVSLFAR